MVQQTPERAPGTLAGDCERVADEIQQRRRRTIETVVRIGGVAQVDRPQRRVDGGVAGRYWQAEPNETKYRIV
jgi:hypothetical protein